MKVFDSKEVWSVEVQYELLEKLGRGGMGQVFRARDKRLNRTVAIKVLRVDEGRDSDRQRRFVQEAQAASALNHPNIITIHDLIDHDGEQWMVMECVGGKSLAEIISRGALPVDLVLDYGLQIADALMTAHSSGIIHRDLKPANVMVTDRGLVKVLDFGLAKMTIPVSRFSESDETTTGVQLTVEGTLLGTVAYMSPEQAQGKAVDSRSDIFSFGTVLYEMITGQRAFASDNTMSTLTAVLRDEARPIPEITPDAPWALQTIVYRCLRKNQNERYQKMSEVHAALLALRRSFEPSLRTQITAPPPPPNLPPTPSSITAGPVGPGPSSISRLSAPPAASFSTVPPPSTPPSTPGSVPSTLPPSTPPSLPPQISSSQLRPPAPVRAPAAPKQKWWIGPAAAVAVIAVSGAGWFVWSSLSARRSGSAQKQVASVDQRAPGSPVQPTTRPPAPPSAPTAPAGSDKAEAGKIPPQKQPGANPVGQPIPVEPSKTTPAPAAPAKSFLLVDGTPLRLSLAEEVPADAEADAPLHFAVSEDVKVDGAIVIRKGARAAGVLVEAAKKRKFLGRGAKATYRLLSVTAVDGQSIRVRATPRHSPEEAKRPLAGNTKDTPFLAYVDGDVAISLPNP